METFLLNMAVIMACATMALNLGVIIFVVIDIIIDDIRQRRKK